MGPNFDRFSGETEELTLHHLRNTALVVNKVKSKQSARSMSTGMEMPGKTTPHLASSIHIL
jgi:hypothetical protein